MVENAFEMKRSKRCKQVLKVTSILLPPLSKIFTFYRYKKDLDAQWPHKRLRKDITSFYCDQDRNCTQGHSRFQEICPGALDTQSPIGNLKHKENIKKKSLKDWSFYPTAPSLCVKENYCVCTAHEDDNFGVVLLSFCHL